jgi:UDP-glucose 4-epimerase
MAKILVTGACGYIGSHTMVDLINNGHDVISVDNLSRGYLLLLENVRKITGVDIPHYTIDLTDQKSTALIFEEHPNIDGIIHFAAFKWVGESVMQPLRYYQNNLLSLMHLLEEATKHNIQSFVFSSSCSVYGNPDHLPVTELETIKEAQSPYASTKQMGEIICKDLAAQHPAMKISLLRYFNPVGSHPSGLLGDLQEKPENIVPVITQTAIGKIVKMQVHGNDYATRDGSCIRDYVHVMDIAHAHTKALEYTLQQTSAPNFDIYNLGSGNGVSVLELIHAFEKVTGRSLSYELGPRRPGDVEAVYADCTKARTILNWECTYSIEQMMETAWRWEEQLAVWRTAGMI